jgi:hypothetical protein
MRWSCSPRSWTVDDLVTARVRLLLAEKGIAAEMISCHETKLRNRWSAWDWEFKVGERFYDGVTTEWNMSGVDQIAWDISIDMERRM